MNSTIKSRLTSTTRIIIVIAILGHVYSPLVKALLNITVLHLRCPWAQFPSFLSGVEKKHCQVLIRKCTFSYRGEILHNVMNYKCQVSKMRSKAVNFACRISTN